MKRQKVKIINATGLHLRAADLMCKTAMQFKCHITFEIGTFTTNAKSVLGMLGAGVRQGDEIEFICEGEDEVDALETMVNLVESGLGE
jgi:Phosphotransferase System HPr (HPr) Family